jgi:hypothetical protein
MIRKIISMEAGSFEKKNGGRLSDKQQNAGKVVVRQSRRETS